MEPANSVHPEVLEEQTPAIISSVVAYLQYVYAAFGWYILGAALLTMYSWSKVKPYYEQWMKKREESEYAAQVHKNPDLYRSRQEAITAARLRMQEEHDNAAKLKAEKAKEREEQKRDEWIARQVGSANPGRRLAGQSNTNEAKTGPSKKKGSSFREEYNPLMGAGGSGGYRPQKRGCPGGGCGKK